MRGIPKLRLHNLHCPTALWRNILPQFFELISWPLHCCATVWPCYLIDRIQLVKSRRAKRSFFAGKTAA